MRLGTATECTRPSRSGIRIPLQMGCWAEPVPIQISSRCLQHFCSAFEDCEGLQGFCVGCPLATRIMDASGQCSSEKPLVQAGHRGKCVRRDNTGVANRDGIIHVKMLGPFQALETQGTRISCNSSL